jgi:hypothetical protein
MIVIEREQIQFPIIFALPFQYRSHSVLLHVDSAVHCPRRFLSVGSRRPHSMQYGVRADSDATKMCTQAIMFFQYVYGKYQQNTQCTIT